MSVRVEAQCKICNKPMVAVSGSNECPTEQLDIFLKWLTCDSCLMKLGRLPKEYWPYKREKALPPLPPEAERGGLPYADD